jgi:outer membrane protein OmpA-like peptidoglycan-associated protein
MNGNTMKIRILTALVAAGLATGCQSMSPQAKDVDRRGEGNPIIMEQRIGQASDLAAGQSYYALCDPCASPTQKNIMPVTKSRPIAISPIVVNPTPQSAVADSPGVEPARAPLVQSVKEKAKSADLKCTVPFAFGRFRLGRQGREAVAAMLEEARHAYQIHIRGYTDIIGTMPVNKRLAMARASQIETFLVNAGVPKEKISVSYCVDCFVDTNETPDGRAANRHALVLLRSTPLDAEPVEMAYRDTCRAN